MARIFLLFICCGQLMVINCQDEQPKYPTKERCADKGGICQNKSRSCDGELKEGKKWCYKSKKYGCCIPENDKVQCPHPHFLAKHVCPECPYDLQGEEGERVMNAYVNSAGYPFRPNGPDDGLSIFVGQSNGQVDITYNIRDGQCRCGWVPTAPVRTFGCEAIHIGGNNYRYGECGFIGNCQMMADLQTGEITGVPFCQ